MDAFLATVSIAAVTMTLVNLAKSILGAARGEQSWNTAITIVVVILIAWAVLILYGASTWAFQVTVGDKQLQDLDLFDKFVAALAVGGIGSVLYDAFIGNKTTYPKITNAAPKTLVRTKSSASPIGPPPTQPGAAP
jgi:hypothetical protein